MAVNHCAVVRVDGEGRSGGSVRSEDGLPETTRGTLPVTVTAVAG
ncbi:hypothetical protein [Streptomyces massasporeus]